MDWKIGDIAICVKTGDIRPSIPGRNPNLRLNSEYVVQNVYICPKCKKVSLDVGLSPQPNGNGKGTLCCTERIPCPEIHWCNSVRFVKKHLRTKKEKIENEDEENGDYELEQLTNNIFIN